jgi:hypothetical protein
VLLAVSSNEAWAATWDGGLWHIRNGGWTNVTIADWQPPLQVFDLDRAPDGTLAVATDRGAAVLRAGRWTVLEVGEAHAVTFAGDGALWVAEATGRESGTQTTVASFRFDGGSWTRTALPTLAASGWPMLGIGPGGEPWVGAGGWDGSLDRFDGARWVRVSPLGGSETVNVGSLAVAPNGDLWVGLLLGRAEPFWAIARYDGAVWTVWPTADILPRLDSNAPDALPGYPFWGGLAFAPDGRLWLGGDRGLVRFDGQHWVVVAGTDFVRTPSFAPDGAFWAVGPSGVQWRPAAAGDR